MLLYNLSNNTLILIKTNFLCFIFILNFLFLKFSKKLNIFYNLFPYQEAHFIATIKKFEEGRCSQNTKSTENVQQLQSRLAELEDQLRREKETNILQLQKAMEYQRVSGLPMENCIVSSKY